MYSTTANEDFVSANLIYIALENVINFISKSDNKSEGHPIRSKPSEIGILIGFLKTGPSPSKNSTPKPKASGIVNMSENKIGEIFDLGPDVIKNLKDRIDEEEWGGDLEIQLISQLYGYNITILRWVGDRYVVSNTEDMSDNGLTLIWVNRNHYRYLKPSTCSSAPCETDTEYLSDASIQSEY